MSAGIESRAPPPKANARWQAGVGVKQAQLGRANRTASVANVQGDKATPWRVVIDGKRRGQLWGRYCSRAGALATVRTLRTHGFTGVRIIGPDCDPLEAGV